MSRPILWRSADGRKIINVLTVAFVAVGQDGELVFYTSGDRAIDGVRLPADDAASFLAALDAASAPAPDTAHIDALIERLKPLRGDMATVGENTLIEIVRDLCIELRSRP